MSYNTLPARLARATLAAAVLVACDAPEPMASAAAFTTLSAARPDPTNSAVYWNTRARELVASRGSSTPFAMRGYAVLSVAQYHAAIAAEKEPVQGVQPSAPAAVAAASVTVLKYLFPNDAGSLDAELAAHLDELRGRKDRMEDVDRGAAIGSAAGAPLVERAQGDAFFAPWNGTVPTGTGIWFSSTNPPTAPAGAAFGQALPFLLHSTSQFRPAPHPAFGSPAFAAALAEVRAYSDSRTQSQDSLAKFWHLPPGTYAPPGYWNEEATTLALKYRTDERRTALVLALTNITMYDALLASHEAKYHYWLLRPSQADAGITLSVGLPNFPSYPSNHAAISAGAAAILGYAFPAERLRLRARAEEAALSRVLGGIHYRFDGEAGLELGRQVAAWTLDHAPVGHRPFDLR